MQRGERRIKVANGVEAEVEVIGDLSLELDDGFRLQLSDILYVLSLCRNLISVSRLDDDDYDCYFGNGKCRIVYNNKCVGLAFQQDKLYLLSLSENVNDVSTENRMLPRLWMQQISGRECMMYLRNYGTVVYVIFQGGE